MVEKILEKQKKKDWGQYFTPPEVVDFMYRMVKIFLPKRTSRYLKVIDPACGEGVFLKYAFENKITTRVNLFGCDIDPKVENEWKRFDIYGKLHLFILDGLLDDEENGIKKNSFDLVMGNPPYGGTGLAELGRLLKVKEAPSIIRDQKIINLFGEEETLVEKRKVGYEIDLKPDLFSKREETELIKLANSLYYEYESWKKEPVNIETEENKEQISFENMQKVEPGKKRTEYILKMYDRIRRDKNLLLSSKDIKKLMTFPIEILFTERFLQLAKPGGLIAIILPDGIYTNSQTQYFRDWLLQKGNPLTLVSLPRKVFTSVGANAKTTILFMKKRIPGEILKGIAKRKVLLTSPNQGNGNNIDLERYFKEVLDTIKKMRI
ncbi:MAG: SAM-dependent methyltransferase [candidate division Zixibacteria bacterium]|nr:SAM-dependent methyltransferase [candidate division Zixibacteria bacterium]